MLRRGIGITDRDLEQRRIGGYAPTHRGEDRGPNVLLHLMADDRDPGRSIRSNTKARDCWGVAALYAPAATSSH
jgi:hypothetical protein